MIGGPWTIGGGGGGTGEASVWAGSVAALELLEYLEKTQTGKAMGRFVPELRADIAADRREFGSP